MEPWKTNSNGINAELISSKVCFWIPSSLMPLVLFGVELLPMNKPAESAARRVFELGK